MQQTEVEKIHEILKEFETAMLVTHGTEIPFHARPMVIARVEPSCDLWFFTGRGSAKVREIENDQHVLIILQDEMSRYVALQASAKLIFDRAKAAELWQESFRPWFPGGVNDPELVLLRAEARCAEYWLSSGFQGVKYLFEAARAYVRGTRPHVQEGEQHGTVNFSE